MEISQATNLKAAIDEVYGAIADIRFLLQRGALGIDGELDVTGSAPNLLGVRFVSRRMVFHDVNLTRGMVIAHEPPDHFALRVDNDTRSFELEYLLFEIDEGTRVEITLRSRSRAPRLVAYFSRPFARSGMKARLKICMQALEGRFPGAG